MNKALTASLNGLLVVGVLILPAVVNAQAKNAAPAAAQPTPTAPVTVTPEARAAIKDLIEVTKTRDNLAKTYQAMTQNLPPQLAQAMNVAIENNASLNAEQKQKVRANMNQPFEAAVKDANTILSDPKVVEESIDRMYPIYAKYFTPDEIRQITAFYKSPVGAKTLTTMPLVISESLQAGFALVQPRLNALIEKTVKTQVDAVAKPSAPAKK